MSGKCRICNEAAAKYKCPKCSLAYCSVVCFRRHKETPCTVAPPPAPLAEVDITEEKQDDEEEGVKVTQAQYHQLRDDERLRSMLKDQRLRTLITDIDSAVGSRREQLLAEAMQYNPDFLQFVDRMLNTVGERRAQDEDASSDMTE